MVAMATKILRVRVLRIARRITPKYVPITLTTPCQGVIAHLKDILSTDCRTEKKDIRFSILETFINGDSLRLLFFIAKKLWKNRLPTVITLRIF
ncbi:MAG: hypothetical protein C7B46_17035 [Sulfobacillus benefaciens]|uniref:Uncharacterized protein n=1 Tax=Sulfobacillus benefaciens TaxID=453960 RepID=A0A2T2X9N4_9FIRM|nr:MAG: hypothetical protein C7B46_17035 [Sulfobacillus benefaciens]